MVGSSVPLSVNSGGGGQQKTHPVAPEVGFASSRISWIYVPTLAYLHGYGYQHHRVLAWATRVWTFGSMHDNLRLNRIFVNPSVTR